MRIFVVPHEICHYIIIYIPLPFIIYCDSFLPSFPSPISMTGIKEKVEGKSSQQMNIRKRKESIHHEKVNQHLRRQIKLSKKESAGQL